MRWFRPGWGMAAWVLPLLALAVIAWVLFRAQGGLAALTVPEGGSREVANAPALVAEGEYLARIGNCVTCHTRRGDAPFSGGRGFASDYGTVHSTNLTPDLETGLGNWTREEFHHAMRHGVSRRGLLYPVFPYAHFAHLDDGDLDALFAYLSQLPAVVAPDRPNTLSLPAGWRRAMVAWRMLFYRPRAHADSADQTDVWRRGRYLVDGLGHCAMCHSGRGAYASLPVERYMAGATILGQGWYAPPLDRLSLARWTEQELADYLRGGVSRHGSAYGSMAEVIYTSLQYLTPEDALAMATYLKSIPPARVRTPPARRLSANTGHADGLRLYASHCAQCHGDDGKGRGLDYPPLAGNPKVHGEDVANPLRLVLFGGVAPVTALNPQPYSMPPFVGRLSDDEVASVVTYIRNAWGNTGKPVTIDDVRAQHRLPLD